MHQFNYARASRDIERRKNCSLQKMFWRKSNDKAQIQQPQKNIPFNDDNRSSISDINKCCKLFVAQTSGGGGRISLNMINGQRLTV